MKLKKTIALTTLAAVGSFSFNSSAAPSMLVKKFEKCGGVAKKGMNDCGANGHSCHGKADKDNDPKEWIYMKAGNCEKVGGKVLKTVDARANVSKLEEALKVAKKK